MAGFHTKCARQRDYRDKANIGFAALHHSDVIAMKPGGFREPLLGLRLRAAKSFKLRL